MAQDPAQGNKAVKRLEKEQKKLNKSPLDYATAGPEKKNDMLKWLAVVHGPKGSPYEGGKFKIEIAFSDQYPMKAPELTFKTKIYHPSVKRDDGKVCPEVIGKNWAPVLNIMYILETIYKMLEEPTADSPLDEEIAEELTTNRKKFDKTAKQWTKKHAK